MQHIPAKKAESEEDSLTTPYRKPRILWASLYSLLDTSSGAAIDAREMLRQLSFNGYDVAIAGATIFDSENGLSRLPEQWNTNLNPDKVCKVIDTPLCHQLVITKSTNRAVITSLELDQWYALYVHMLDTFKPDLVYCFGGMSFDLLVPDEARQRGIPTAFLLVNGSYQGTRWCRDVDLIITISKANAEYYRQKIGIDLTTVGIFIDPSVVQASQHTRRNLLFINPTLSKGAGVVIQLALLLEKIRPDITIEVVESRSNWPRLLNYVTTQLGSPRDHLENVLVTPHTNDMRPVYGRARVLLAPSLWWECAGRVAVEAMINGIPAIVTDRGGLPEMIGNAGVKIKLPEICHEKPFNKLLNSAFLEPLVKKIIQFYDDELLYSEYVARAKLVAERTHSLNSATERLISAFQPLTEKRAGDNMHKFVPERPHKQEQLNESGER